ncbi:MAG: hypothetical protein JJT96_03365 [Opitutales bacterium]|nr:hypothetical protein [Opitutales bacterium]
MRHTFDIGDFGAIGDGTTLNTAAIQAAMEAAAAASGGTVYVPAGTYLTGTLHLRSGITLEMHPAAVLLGSPRIEDYDTGGVTEDIDRNPWHLLVAHDCSHITLRGGTIDGNGPAFWEEVRGDDPLTCVVAREPDPARAPLLWIHAHKDRRPSPMIDFTGCRHIRIVDTIIRNSAGWNLHLHCCDYVWIRGVHLEANLRGPNNDGFDVTGCRDVMISDCHLSCCDDAIVLKTTKDSRSVERVTVTNCIIRTPCAALKLGANESFHDFRQITFSNCVVYESNRAFALYSLEGGHIEDVVVSNIVCDTRAPFLFNRPIHFDVRRRNPGSRLGSIRHVVVSQFIARTDGRILLTAEEPGVIEDVVLRDVRMVYPVIDDPAPAANPAVGGTQFSSKTLDARSARAAVVAENIGELVLENLAVAWPASEEVPAEWDFSLKAAAGTHALFERTDFRPVDRSAFHVLWARRCTGWIRCPSAKASGEGVEPFHLEDSDVVIARA